MANKTIPDLTAGAAVGAADLFEASQSAASVKLTAAQILTYVSANLDPTLVAVAGVTFAANKGLYSTGADAFATYDLTAGGRALGGVAGAADTFPYFSASNVVTLGSITAYGRALLALADAKALDALSERQALDRAKWGIVNAVPFSATMSASGLSAPTAYGTASAAGPANTNYLTRQHRTTYTSATTADALAGIRTPAWLYRVDGFGFVSRFGASQIPASPRLFVGMQPSSGSLPAADFDTLVESVWFGLRAADTTIQFFSNDGAGTATATNTGIAFVANAFYEARIWASAGGNINGRLTRLDTGAVWEGTLTTDLPATTSPLHPNVAGALSSVTGTALIFEVGTLLVRSGA